MLKSNNSSYSASYHAGKVGMCRYKCTHAKTNGRLVQCQVTDSQTTACLIVVPTMYISCTCSALHCLVFMPSYTLTTAWSKHTIGMLHPQSCPCQSTLYRPQHWRSFTGYTNPLAPRQLTLWWPSWWAVPWVQRSPWYW